MSKTSPTVAGLTNANAQPINRDELIEAINQIFTLFRINFHNQYYKAYPEAELLNQAKRLWFESLKHYQPATLLSATKRIIEEQEYLPTLHQMLAFCAEGNKIPSAHQAYVEACRAPSPKSSYKWSHPAVYEAGRRTDWFLLSTTPEHIALPIFKGNYNSVLSDLREGHQIEIPSLEALPEKSGSPVDKETGISNLKALRKQLDI